MKWFVAHAILYFHLNNVTHRTFWVYENLHLVQAASFAEARLKAQRFASQAAGDDMGTLTLDGEPAELVFLGIRKVVLCENSTEPAADGDELTYNKFEMESWEALQDLATGKPTRLLYEAEDHSEEAGTQKPGEY